MPAVRLLPLSTIPSVKNGEQYRLPTPDIDVVHFSVIQFEKTSCCLSLPPSSTSLTPVVNLGLGVSSRNLVKFKMILFVLPGGAQSKVFLEKI